MDEDRKELLVVMQDQVREIWNKSRPNLVKALKEQGELRQVVQEAAKGWLETTEALLAQGMDYAQADNAARREWVVLPDLGEMEEYEEETFP